MATFSEFKQLRLTAAVTDDADWAGGDPQTLPADSICVQLKGGDSIDKGKSLKVEVVLEWVVNATGAVEPTGRGTFNIQGIRVVDRARSGPTVIGDSSVAGSPTLCVVDTAAVAGIAYRPIIIDELQAGDKFTVRLTTMVPATGGTGFRVLYREIYD